MGFYENKILPHLINIACGQQSIFQQRQQLVPQASGVVLEVGVGSGLNLPHYRSENIKQLWALEPSLGMQKFIEKKIENLSFPVSLISLPGEEIPLEDNSVDTIVLTYTLCSISDYKQALTQMRRVLKPGGTLLYSEHGLAPDPAIQKWQNRINPFWNKISGGCNLNRPVSTLLEKNGFKVVESENRYLEKSLRVTGYNYSGVGKIG